MPGAGAPVEAEEEQTEFDVILEGVGDKKIQVIKVVREVTSLGLKEAKELVDNAPGTVVKERFPRTKPSRSRRSWKSQAPRSALK